MRRGFTLIELLIVVAIIAILAAIAVPNFLEAQTRSKVSRVHADMRSIATALEAYSVDNNRPPICWREGGYTDLELHGSISATKWAWQITTPIAYMSDVPGDPFLAMTGTIGDPTNNDWKKFPPNTTFQYDNFVYGNKWTGSEGGPIDPDNQISRLNAHGFVWMLQSSGPSRYYNIWPHSLLEYTYNTPGAGAYGTYDPTNGTKSVGLIIRTNKGILESPSK